MSESNQYKAPETKLENDLVDIWEDVRVIAINRPVTDVEESKASLGWKRGNASA